MSRRRPSICRSAAEWLLRLLLGSDQAAQAILGDLLEEHGRRVRSGSRAADWWLLRQAVLMAPYALRERRRRRRRPRLAERSASSFEGVLQDLRDAFRSLASTKQSTSSAIATMALGIGGATAIFSLVDGILLKPLPFASPERLVIANELAPGGTRTGVSWLDFKDWKNSLVSFDELAAVEPVNYILSNDDGATRLTGRRVTWNFLRVLGVRPMLGRDLVPDDDLPGAGRVVLVSHRFWAEHLGSRTDAVGRTVIVDREPHVIVGVLPRSFRFGRDDDVYAPIGALASSPSFRDRGNRGPLRAVGRLKSGTAVEEARRELTGRAAVLTRAYPASNSGSAPISSVWTAALSATSD